MFPQQWYTESDQSIPNLPCVYKEVYKMKKLFSLLICAMLLLNLTACGGSSKATGAVVREEAAAEAPAMMADNAASLKGAESGSSVLPEGRKWIITIDMNVETDNLDNLLENLDRDIRTRGGYVEDQNIHNGSTYASRRYRSANLTIRIPDEQAEQFTSDISGFANVVSQNLRREDITLKYVATSSRVTALETEEARLLELLAKAENMTDLLGIEARLTDVRYELENHASQLRLYDNQIDYATIYLYIEEVQEYTPVEEPGFFERIKTTFAKALEGLKNGIANITVFLVGNSPYILVFTALGFVIVKLAKHPQKIRFSKKQKKEEQK